MPIYTPKTDYSALKNAISYQADAAQAGHRITQQGIDMNRMALQDKSLDLQENKMNFDYGMMWYDAALDAAKLGVQTYDHFKKKAVQAELATAKTTADDAAVQFYEIIEESSLNRGSKAVQGEDGKWDIQPDPAIGQWYVDQMDAIAASSDSKEVKQWRMQALSETYRTGMKALYSSVLNQTQATIDDQYGVSLSKALENDAQTGSYEMGIAVIGSRSDFTDQQKQVAFANYQKSVDKRFQTSQVSKIAFTEGLDKATEYAYSLKGFTPEEIQGFVTTATKTDSQVTAAIATNASSIMSNGLNAGASPSELYKAVEDRVDGMPEDRRQTAIDTARATHTAWATKQGYALANIDLESVDVEYLTKQKASITQKNGSIYKSVFSGLDQTAATFGAMYDKRIDELKKLSATTLTNLSKEQVKENKTIADATLALLKNGDISPTLAMQAVQGLNTGNTDSNEDDLYQMEMLTKINDEIVPERYKPLTTKFLSEMESLKFGLKIDSKKGMTAEQTTQIAEARDFANTAIANIFMNTAANEISPNEVAEQLGMIKNTFISKSVAALESGEVVDRWRLINDPKAIDDALDKNHQFGGLSTVAITMDRNGSIQWADKDQKATYDAVADSIANELRSMGIQVTSESSPLMVNRVPKPVPTFRAKLEGGDAEQWVTVNKGDVFTSTDGKSWYPWKSIPTKEKFKTETAVDRYFNQFRTPNSGTRAW